MMSGMGTILGAEDDDEDAPQDVVEFIMFVYKSSAAHFVKHFRERIEEHGKKK